jgi:poly(A) polymerase
MPRPGQTPRQAAVGIVRQLREAGYTAYLAGGCVRDALLGQQPKDYDVATDARPEQVRETFPHSKYVGEAFGVVLVYRGRQAIEAATFRQEWGYADKRRPDEVVFAGPEEDARRRDFTINGLFADPLETDPLTGGDRIIDYVGGRDDLAAGLIRAIGDPAERFGEDYLRMLRAGRFAARLGFDIESRTAAAMRPLGKYLGQISRERIGQEIRWMLTGPEPARAAELIQTLGLDAPALKEDHAQHPLPTLRALTRDGEAPAYPLMLAGWLIDRRAALVEQPDPAAGLQQFVETTARPGLQRWREALCLPNEDRDRFQQLLTLAARAVDWDQLNKSQRKRLLAADTWPLARRLIHAALPADLPRRLDREAAPLLAEGVAPEPLVTGQDLIALGLKPGPQFGQLLKDAYDAQLAGEVADRHHALAWLRERAGPDS